MKKVNWLIVGIMGIILLLFLFGGGIMMGGWGYRGWGMMGWGYSPFGSIGMFFMWLIPLGFIVLTVLGVAWLVRISSSPTSLSTGHDFASCGLDVQADWQNCPYCGTALK